MFRRNRFYLVLLFSLFIAGLGGCAYPRPTPNNKPIRVESIPVDTTALHTYAKNATVYTVGPFDRIDLMVWNYPDLTRSLLVKEDGTVFVPNAGHIELAGLTLREAQNKLTQALAVVIDNPQIDLTPVEIRSKRFYVLGEVKMPGGYPIYKSMTLREALSLAGGTTEYSLLENAYLSRGGKAYPIDIYGMLTSSGNDVYLQANDVLYIPSQTTSVVYVMGEVVRPSSVGLNGHGLNVLQAIAQAGGITHSADEDEVAVIRRNGEKIDLYVVDVEDALKTGGGNGLTFVLRPGDIIWVPPMGIANWNRGLEMISPTLDVFLFKPLTGVRDFFLIKDIIDRGNSNK
jgi:polysaccharide export outer membrane protein